MASIKSRVVAKSQTALAMFAKLILQHGEQPSINKWLAITGIRANMPRIVYGGGMVLSIGDKGGEDMPDVPLVRS